MQRHPVPHEIITRVEKMLVEGEEIRLITQPARWRILRDAWFGVPLGVFYCIMFYVLVSPNFRAKPDVLLIVLFGLFELMGIMLLLMPLWAIRNARYYIYVITSKRAIIIQPVPFSRERVQSFGRRDMTQMTVRPLKKGFGDLYFVAQPAARMAPRIGFLGIPHVNDVRKVMLETFEFNEDDFWRT